MSRPRTLSLPAGLRRAGFTLIELMLVMVILTVLAALVVPRFVGRAKQAKVQAAQTDISNIENALGMFNIDCGHFPTSSEGLQALVQDPGDVKGWNGPYFKKGHLPKDPWGNAYQYICPPQHNKVDFDLFSCGPDGQAGTEDDIDNWTEK